MTDLRFLCFNIHFGYDNKGQRDLSRIHDLMEELDIDIGVFQEMETRPSKGGTEADINELAGASRPHHLPGPTMKEGLGWYGNLIVSRYPIIRAMAHTLEKSWTYEPRNAVDATIETPFGPIRVLGTHLSLTSWERKEEVDMLLRLVRRVEGEEHNPVFLMGDFNEWRRSSRLLKGLDDLMTPVKAGASFPSRFPIFPLDRVWHDVPGLEVKATVLKTKEIRALSDHLPVLVEISGLSQILHIK